MGRCRCYEESVVLAEGRDNQVTKIAFSRLSCGTQCMQDVMRPESPVINSEILSFTGLHDFFARVQLRSAALHAVVSCQTGQDLRLSCITSLGKDDEDR